MVLCLPYYSHKPFWSAEHLGENELNARLELSLRAPLPVILPLRSFLGKMPGQLQSQGAAVLRDGRLDVVA